MSDAIRYGIIGTGKLGFEHIPVELAERGL